MNWLRGFFAEKEKADECSNTTLIVTSEIQGKQEHQMNTSDNDCSQTDQKEQCSDNQKTKLESFYCNKTNSSTIPVGSLLIQSSDLTERDDSHYTYFQSRSMTTHYSRPKSSFTGVSSMSQAYVSGYLIPNFAD
jgi:hypothetical protein